MTPQLPHLFPNIVDKHKKNDYIPCLAALLEQRLDDKRRTERKLREMNEQQQVWLAVSRLAKDTNKDYRLRIHTAYSMYLKDLKVDDMPTQKAKELLDKVHQKLSAKFVGGNPINQLKETECEQLGAYICGIYQEFIL